MKSYNSHCVIRASAMFFTLLCLYLASVGKLQAQAPKLTPAQIMLKSYDLKDTGKCDSVVLLLNTHLTELREDGKYEGSLNLLQECYKTLAMPDSVEQMMLKKLDYYKNEMYDVKSNYYKMLLTDVIDYWHSEKDTGRQIKYITMSLDTAMYNFDDEYDRDYYERKFSLYAALIDTVPVDRVDSVLINKYAESLFQMVQDCQLGKDKANEYLESKISDKANDVLNKTLVLYNEGKFQEVVTLLVDNMHFFTPENDTFNNDLSRWIDTDKLFADSLDNNKEIRLYNYDTALGRLAEVYGKLGQTDKAEAALVQLKDEKENRYGKKSSEYESVINSLIVFHSEYKNRAKEAECRKLLLDSRIYDFTDELERWIYSERLYHLSRTLWDAAETPADSIIAADSYENLAGFYLQYISDPKFRDNYIDTNMLLQTLYEIMKEYEKEIQVCDRVQNFIATNHLESTYSKNYEEVINRPAIIYGDYLNDSSKAIDSYLAQMKYYESKNDDMELLRIFTRLWLLYRDTGDLENIEKILVRTVEKTLAVYGKNSYEYAKALYYLGTMYIWDNPDYSRAVELLTEAKQLKDSYIENERQWDYRILLEQLGYAKILSGNTIDADTEYEEAGEYWYDEIYKMLFVISSEIRTEYWGSMSARVGQVCDLAYMHRAKSLFRLSYNDALMSKGLLLRTANAIRKGIVSSGDKALLARWEELSGLRNHIDSIKQNEEYDEDSFKKLTARERELDIEITKASADYRDLKADMAMTWQEVQRNLQPGEAAIEFVDFKHGNDTTLYAALVLRAGMDSPEWIMLCDEKELSPLLKAVSNNQQAQINYTYQTNGAKLYDAVWKPLNAVLEGVKTVYYSPSRLLHKVALNALPAEGNSVLLSDKYDLTLVSSTREVVRIRKNDIADNGGALPIQSATVYGGLYYDENQQPAENRTSVPQEKKPVKPVVSQAQNLHHRGLELTIPSYELRAASGIAAWNYLDGTRHETEQIAGELNNRKIPHKYLTKLAGDEVSFKQLNGNSSDVLFLATHGFFFSDIQVEQHNGLKRILGRGRTKLLVENPLLRSGLVLSKVNKYWLSPETATGEEDNILTADEISKLNLADTQLVVLSACETGLGDIKNSEGVFGLQRAFKLAGVESLIMSLWKVPDEATALLMSTFYSQWLDGAGKQSAFKTAQHTVRAQYPEPFYWAAFVMMD